MLGQAPPPSSGLPAEVRRPRAVSSSWRVSSPSVGEPRHRLHSRSKRFRSEEEAVLRGTRFALLLDMDGTRSVRFGRVFGIQLAFDYSWLFIAFLLSWSLAAGFLRWHPDWSRATAVVTAVIAALLFFASVLLHELAHSLVARRFGVPVRGITLFLFGGVSNIEREPPTPKAEALTAIVGPLTSIVIGVVLIIAGSAALNVSPGAIDDPTLAIERLSPVATLLMWLGPINLLVGVFNLIPAFPLDGGRILRAALWSATHSFRTATRWASMIGEGFGWALVVLGVAMAFGANVPFFGRGLVGGLWLAFIGWFLSSAAARTWRRELLHELLDGVVVSRVMRPAGTAVSPDMNIETLVDKIVLQSDLRAFPVMTPDGGVAGMIALADVRRVPRPQWRSVRVGEVMTPAPKLVTASPNDELMPALEPLLRADLDQAPVIDGAGHLVGMLFKSDILRWIELHDERGAQRYAH